VEFSRSDARSGGKKLLSGSDEAESSRYMASRRDPCEYLAKYVTKQGGDIHFGGTFNGVNFSEFRKSRNAYGRREIVHSPNLPRHFFHMNNPRRKK
jgi:hypothetical protein